MSGEFVRETADFVGVEGNRLAATVYRPPPLEVHANKKSAPVLFMHGGGQTRHSWDGPARQIATMGKTAITVDARGHGESEWVKSRNYTFHHYSQDLCALASQVDERYGQMDIPCVVVGASMGGISAMLAQATDNGASSKPLFSAIVLVDITPRMARSGVDRIMGFMADGLRNGFDSVEEAAAAVAAYLPNRKKPKSLAGLQKNLRRRNDGKWVWHWDPAFIDGENNITSGRVSRQHTLVEAARKISVPTLLIRGGKSELVTREAAQEFLQLVPHARYVDVSGAGHMVAGDENDIFADAVLGFLSDFE